MSSFGQWYENQRAAEDGGSSNSSWFSTEEVLPMFNTDSLQGYTDGLSNLSIDSMRQTMEAQMPKKILGMGYQQRFKVSHFIYLFRTSRFCIVVCSKRPLPTILPCCLFPRWRDCRCFVLYFFYRRCFLHWHSLWDCLWLRLNRKSLRFPLLVVH